MTSEYPAALSAAVLASSSELFEVVEQLSFVIWSL